jgi:hypothetical protein
MMLRKIWGLFLYIDFLFFAKIITTPFSLSLSLPPYPKIESTFGLLSYRRAMPKKFESIISTLCIDKTP